MKGVTIVICCHNSGSKILPTLRHLQQQEATFPWEVIVVNNNSTDDTVSIVRQAWNEVKVVDEKQPGLRHARETGIRHAQYDFIVFCDDDNHLAKDYIDKVFTTFSSDDSIALIGGIGKAVADVALPSWFEDFKGLFAVGATAVPGTLPLTSFYIYGAGMGMRKQAWDKLNSLGFKSAAVDRKGTELSGGHDVELSFAMRLIGYKVVFDDTLRFDHYMDSNRLTVDYLLALARGSAANFTTFVYHALLERHISSSVGFAYALTKTIVWRKLTVLFLKRVPLEDAGMANEVYSEMNRSSSSFYARNFSSALGYFRHVKSIHDKIQSAK